MCDHFYVNFVVLISLRSIRTSRKRKLHVFFAVAQEVDSIPHPLPIADDEPLTNPEESKFFHDNVVLQ